MKTLYLVRHAKSSWKDETLDDFDRPLKKRGYKDLSIMTKLFKEWDYTVDLIISSPANRAKSTALIFQETLTVPLQFKQALYDNHFDSIDGVVNDLDDRYDNIMLIGHNPSLNLFAEQYAYVYENIPTTGIVGVKFDIDSWKDISEDRAIFKCFEYPKLYRF